MADPQTSPTPPLPPVPPTPSPSSSSPHQKPRWTFSIWRLVVGGFIILFGAQLLASNYGWDWSMNIDPVRLWPIILILIGISMITKGRVISAIVGSFLALAVLGVAAVIMVTQPTFTSHDSITRSINVAPEATATTSTIRVDLGAADINIRGGATELVSGRFESSLSDITLHTTLNGTDQVVTIGTKDSRRSFPWFGSFKNTLDLQLNETLPLDLDIDTGAASLDLDLTSVQTRRVTIDAGASSIDLALGDLIMNQSVNISSGASSIDVSIPKTITGVRLMLDAGLSGKTLPSEFKKISDELYETADYATAAKKIDITIDAGASSIDVVWK